MINKIAIEGKGEEPGGLDLPEDGARQVRFDRQRGMKSEKGIVLVVVLVLSAVVLAIMTALIYMITSGTQISGLQKRYRTALEAAQGGSDLLYQVIGTRGDTTGFSNVIPSIVTPVSCTGRDIYSGQTYSGIQAKLKTPSTTWSGCDSSLTIDPSNANTYDVAMTIGTSPQYNFYAKIVGAIEGNSRTLSGAVGGLYSGSVITKAGGAGSVPVVSMPYMYAIEVDAVNAANSNERARLSVLYQY